MAGCEPELPPGLDDGLGDGALEPGADDGGGIELGSDTELVVLQPPEAMAAATSSGSVSPVVRCIRRPS